MVASQEKGGNIGIIDSMDIVEFDCDEGVLRAEYDTNRDRASLVVVAVIAALGNKDALELAPLHSSVDTDALDTLFSATDNRQRSRSISFSYEGFQVTVFSEGTIEADPIGTM